MLRSQQAFANGSQLGKYHPSARRANPPDAALRLPLLFVAQGKACVQEYRQQDASIRVGQSLS